MSKHKWYKGHVGRFWDPSSYKELPYKRQPVTQEEIDVWEAKGYDHVKSFTGSMYTSENPMPEWVHKLSGLFDFKNLTYTFYKMQTLEIMPEHSDHYRTYMKLHGAEFDNVCRILVMLEDWKPGHYLEIDGVGIVNWIAGDYFVWESGCPHAASNIGVEDRYTLQITCEKINSNDIWKSLHWYNIPKLESKRPSVIDPFMFNIRQKLNNPTNPYMVYMYNQHIPEMDDIIHDSETVDYLNQHGLDIYLYEPLCSYVENAPQQYPPFGTKHNRWFYSEFNSSEDPQTIRADELDSIQNYVQRNGLTNVTVRSCDYDMDKHFPYYKPYMKLVCDDLFVKTCIPIKVADPTPSDQFTKRFICANWRYTPHRNLIAAYVAPLSSYTSWYFRADFCTIAEADWFNLHEWKDSDAKIEFFNKMIVGTQYLTRNAPLNIDLNIKESIMIKHRYFIDNHFPGKIIYDQINNSTSTGETETTNSLEKFYRDIFCDIVTESRFAQATGNYSEKVYQPMFYKKPFVLCAPPHTLKYLKEEGFKTFSDFWDESYDSIENHESRLFAIFKVIDFINDKSIDELREMYRQMIPILEHNEQLVRNKLKV
jgi:hypothetical protein